MGNDIGATVNNGIGTMGSSLGSVILSLKKDLCAETETSEGTEPAIQLRQEAIKKAAALYANPKTRSKELLKLLDETYESNDVPEVKAEAGRVLGYSKRQIWVNNNKGEAASILCFAGVAAAYVFGKVYNSETFLDKADKLANLIFRYM